MGHRACVRMVNESSWAITHALSDPGARASLSLEVEPVERAATSEPRSMWRHDSAHSAARHMRETAIVNFRPGINDYRYITVANTLLNLILLHHGLQVCRTTAITTKSEQSAQWIDVHAALLNLFAREPHDARGDDPTCAISRRQW